MNVNRINLMTFSGRIKKNQIAEKTKKEIQKQSNNNDKKSNYTMCANVLSTAAGTAGTAVPTIYILCPTADKSV